MDNRRLSVIQRSVIIMKYCIIAEVRESYPSLLSTEKVYNDYVSKKSMLDLVDGIRNAGYDCHFMGGIKELYNLYESQSSYDDIIFINYNYGVPAQYKRVQGPALLEVMKAKYSGSDPFVSLLVNDKAYCKKVLAQAHILTPNAFLLYDKSSINTYLNKNHLMTPLVLKPNTEGSSLGIDKDCLCLSYESAITKATLLLEKYPQILAEEYIEGYECTVWIMGNKTNFPFIKPLIISCDKQYYFQKRIFTMEDKANHVKDYDIPSNHLPLELVNQLETISKTIFIELGLRDYARIDYRIKDGQIYFLEINALPIFSKTSEIGAISQLYNISYSEICNTLVSVIQNRLMS